MTPGGARWTWPRLALAVAAPLLAAGCGFQLRGAIEIPAEFHPVYLQAAGALGPPLEDRLRGGAVALTGEPARAGLVLRVLNQQRNSRIVAVDRDGRALAYELSYLVTFDALGRAGRALVPTQTLSAVRTFDDNPDVEVLGKQLEAEIIYRDLIDDVADRILLRLRAALRTP